VERDHCQTILKQFSLESAPGVITIGTRRRAAE
jgi:hypothetical protein